MFKLIRRYPNEIVQKETPDVIEKCTEEDNTLMGSNFAFGILNIGDRNTELFECIEYSLKGKRADVIAGLVQRALAHAEEPEVIDLCSGSGGPMVQVVHVMGVKVGEEQVLEGNPIAL